MQNLQGFLSKYGGTRIRINKVSSRQLTLFILILPGSTRMFENKPFTQLNRTTYSRKSWRTFYQRHDLLYNIPFPKRNVRDEQINYCLLRNILHCSLLAS